MTRIASRTQKATTTMRVIPIDSILCTITPIKVYRAIACEILQFGSNLDDKRVLLTKEENATAVDPRTLNTPVKTNVECRFHAFRNTQGASHGRVLTLNITESPYLHLAIMDPLHEKNHPNCLNYTTQD